LQVARAEIALEPKRAGAGVDFVTAPPGKKSANAPVKTISQAAASSRAASRAQSRG